jgi:opacity protein-like surface antigen
LAQAVLDGPGVIEDPDAVLNDGFEPELFDLLAEGLTNYPGALAGEAFGALMSGSLSFGSALGGGVVAGYGFGNGLRVEADLSRQSFSASDVVVSSALIQIGLGELDGSNIWTWTVTDEAGDVFPNEPVPFDYLSLGADLTTHVSFLLVSGFYDIDTGTAVTPYLGAGIGLAHVSSQLIIPSDCGCGLQYVVDGSAIVPAGQVGGGLRVALGGPATLDIGYRYKLAGSASVTSMEVHDDSFGPDAGFSAIGHSQSGLIGIHTLQAGLSFALN